MFRGIDRRLDPRAEARILLEILSPEGEAHPMETINLSSSGALCRSDRVYPLHTIVLCRLHVPRGGENLGRSFEARAIVLRAGARDADGLHLTSLHFVDVDPADREVLRRYVFSLLHEKDPGAEARLPAARKA